MRWIHPDHPGRAIRLAYCMNLHAGETLAEIRAGIASIALPLRDRVGGGGGGPFGVGAYFPATVALELAGDAGRASRDELAAFLAGEGLQPFTFNAFPYGGFHADGLKERVYAPTWREPERVAFTLAVARITEAFGASGLLEGVGHVSISTHPGAFGADVSGPRDLHDCADGMASVVVELARIAARGGPEIVLSLEAEPRASANDSAALAEFLVVARVHVARRLVSELGLAMPEARARAAASLGTCLDCCHSAVEFEDPERALELARLDGSLGKIQFSSALALRRPTDDPARAALLRMDEPRYLHQVTGRRGSGRMQVADLPELAAALAGSSAPAWLECDEWRCHFHVPVDLEGLDGLATTRGHADAILNAAIAAPSRWTGEELHVEIETYTWDVLPGPARGAGELVDGLEREYRAVMELLSSAGWGPE